MRGYSARVSTFAFVVLAMLVASCAAPPERAAPGERAPAAEAQTGGPYSAADVAFMQGMIAHHAQALVMTDMVPERTENRDIRTLARRVEATQETEILRMRRWLEARDEPVPEIAYEISGDDAMGPHAPAMDHAHMAGMLTAEELDRLAAASGEEFDRLFLESMISHHRGALVMVADLFATEGAGQEAEVFMFASDVDADQRGEIARMENLLNALERGS